MNQFKGFIYAQKDPTYPYRSKENDIFEINRLCDQLETKIPDLEGLIKRIFPHIGVITEQTKVAAIYLLIGRAFSTFKSMLTLCRYGKNLEAMDLSRSAKEALDLVMLFWDDNNKPLFDKWLNGRIISNEDSRKFQHGMLNAALTEEFENEEKPIDEMMKYAYKTMSTYTHSGYEGMLESVDVFRMDLDFEDISGYHYCVDNFHVVEDLYKKILLQLRNSFIFLGDQEGAEKVKILYEPYTEEISIETMNKVVERHKK